MIKPQDIYRKTNDGLDIIHYYYPESRGVEGTKNKFRCRTDERTPSACLLKKDYPGWSVWKVVDFGDDGHAIDPIDICKKEEGISRMIDGEDAAVISCTSLSLTDNECIQKDIRELVEATLK